MLFTAKLPSVFTYHKEPCSCLAAREERQPSLWIGGVAAAESLKCGVFSRKSRNQYSEEMREEREQSVFGGIEGRERLLI